MSGLFLAALTLAILALAVQVIASAFRSNMAGGDGPRPADERIVSASVVDITAGRIVPEFIAYGEVRSVRTLELRAPQAGRVAELSPRFADGAAVTAGEVLIRLDPAEATAARDLAAAALAEAEAAEREAARALILAGDDLAAAEDQVALRAQALVRQRDIAARGAGSAAAVETAALAESSAAQAVLSSRSALAAAEARVDQTAIAVQRARISLAEAERSLAETVIRAEFTGRLNGVAAVVAGGQVSSNERLGEVIDPTALEVTFRLSTAQYARLLDDAGALQPAKVTVFLEVAGADIAAEGRVVRTGAAGAEAGGGRLVYAALDVTRGLRPGDFVTLRIAEPALDGVADLPATALDADGRVLALGADDRLEEVVVEVLRRQGDRVIVAPGALVGREIVAERSPLIGAGIKVRPVRPGDLTEARADAGADAGPDAGDVTLTEDRRADLILAVENHPDMSEDAKARLIEQLRQDRVPVQVIDRIEARAGG